MRKYAAKELKSEDITDVAVSCDGTWQRRGFKSLNGAVACISMESGKVLDIEVMSRYCQSCVTNESLKDIDPVKYQQEIVDHYCMMNHKGSAPRMEQEGVKCIFDRSIKLNGLRYTDYYGDGDTKSYLEIKNVYPDIEVKKSECIGHVQKRVGNRLRKLKKSVQGLGGAGSGQLNNAVIDRLQNYFGIAIRTNVGNLEGMKKAIYASLFHVASSEKNQWHDHCPKGKDSWCGFQVDEANGTKTYKSGGGLNKVVVSHVKPIFENLASDELLRKCLHGLTQNQNESFNGTVWNRVPKETYVDLRQFEIGIYDAISNFNMGNVSIVNTFKNLEMDPGYYTKQGCMDANMTRINNANRQLTTERKSRRKIIRGLKKLKSVKTKAKEGKTYKAGEFS